MNNLEAIEQAVRRLEGVRGARKLRVLVADDEEGCRVCLRIVLQRAADAGGFEVSFVEASDGAEALEAILDNGFDYVFIDVRMPKLDGVQVFKRAMDKQRDEGKRIIFVTGYDEFPELREALDSGVLEVLRKPVEQIHVQQFFPIYGR